MMTNVRNTVSQMFFKIGVLKNFAIFTRKVCNFIKNRLQHRCFPVAKFLRTIFYGTPPVVVFIMSQ